MTEDKDIHQQTADLLLISRDDAKSLRFALGYSGSVRKFLSNLPPIGEWQHEYPEDEGYYWIKSAKSNAIEPGQVRWGGTGEGRHQFVVSRGAFLYREDIDAFWSIPIEKPE